MLGAWRMKSGDGGRPRSPTPWVGGTTLVRIRAVVCIFAVAPARPLRWLGDRKDQTGEY